MINIDHDALARRIATDLNNASKLSRSSYWFMEDAALYIAATLREALPTSEEKALTPEQAGIAKKLVSIPSAVWSPTASSLAHHLLRELLET